MGPGSAGKFREGLPWAAPRARARAGLAPERAAMAPPRPAVESSFRTLCVAPVGLPGGAGPGKPLISGPFGDPDPDFKTIPTYILL